MGLFDDLKKARTAAGGLGDAVAGAVKKAANKSENVTFSKLPDNFDEFRALPQAQLTSPFDTAALTVIALCFYPQDKETSINMLNFLKGPQPLAEREKQFIRDRIAYQDYVPRSYFKGATPDNDYTPSEPYTVHISENAYSHDSQGYVKLFISCSGSDSDRPIVLRQTKDSKWYLWEFSSILSGIRQIESANPWA